MATGNIDASTASAFHDYILKAAREARREAAEDVASMFRGPGIAQFVRSRAVEQLRYEDADGNEFWDRAGTLPVGRNLALHGGSIACTGNI